jgi:hypothetical protein
LIAYSFTCYYSSLLTIMSWDSSVRIAMGYGLDGRGKRIFCTSQHADWLWAHPASYPMDTEGPFLGWVKRLGPDADQSPPPSAKVKNVGAIHPLPHFHGIVLNKHRNNFTFYVYYQFVYLSVS